MESNLDYQERIRFEREMEERRIGRILDDLVFPNIARGILALTLSIPLVTYCHLRSNDVEMDRLNQTSVVSPNADAELDPTQNYQMDKTDYAE